MSKFLGEHAKFTQAIIGAAVSSADSDPIALADVSRVTVHCGILSDLATAKMTVAAPASFSIVCGTAGQGVSSFTALTSANLNLGEATALEANRWETVRIQAGVGASAEKASTRQVIVNGTTFQCKEAATIADYQLPSSDNRVFVEGLASAIRIGLLPGVTYMNFTTGADSSQVSYMDLRRKAKGPGELSSGITISTPLASQSTGCVIAYGVKKSGIIEFRPGQVLATNASYTHFGVRFKSTGTYGVTASVICVTGYQATNSNRTEL